MKHFKHDPSKVLMTDGESIFMNPGKKFVQHYNDNGRYYNVSDVKLFKIFEHTHFDQVCFILGIYNSHNEGLDYSEDEHFASIDDAKKRMAFLISVINGDTLPGDDGVCNWEVAYPVKEPKAREYKNEN